MRQPVARKKLGRFEYDPATGKWILAATALGAIVLFVVALNNQGSPRMDDKAQIQQGVTIPNPTQLSPPQTTGAPR